MSETRKASSTFFLLWFFVVSISIYIGASLSSPLGDFLFSLHKNSYGPGMDRDFEEILSFIFLVSLLMGLSQWLVINTRSNISLSWIPATAISFTVGSFISFFILAYLSDIFLGLDVVSFWVAVYMMAGMGTGVCQWISVNKKLSKSFYWSLITGLSLSSGLFLMMVVSNYLTDKSVSSIAFSVTVGLISGIFAEPLIIHSKTDNTTQQRLAS